MRTPEHRAHPRAGKDFEVDLDMNYLGPGAFTVLPLDPERIPDPPPAPPSYRLTPTNRRQKHKSFAIIGESTPSSPNSRSSSPSGRVSPFKGRGFNPIGSRLASPSISPTPPDDPRAISPRPGAVVTSRIPKPTAGSQPRKPSSGAIFGERVSHVNFRGLNRQSSQSLTSLEEKSVRKRPPPSPRKKLKGPLAFKELSPIQGSSPEPSQSLSSPSRIPTKSKSTPPSRLASPTREQSRAPSRNHSRTNLAQSRDESPLASSTKIPIKKFEHVQSKINSFSNKPKVPPKPVVPPMSSDLSEDNESPKKKVLTRKNSLNRTSSRPNLLPKTYMGNKNQNYTSDSSLSTEPINSHKSKTISAKTFGPKVHTTNTSNLPSVARNSGSVAKTNSLKPSASKTNQTPKSVNKKEHSTPSAQKSILKENEMSTDGSHTEGSGKKTSVKGSKLDLTNLDFEDDSIPSTMDVVSSTTTTVTKPLKIDTPKLSRSTVSPIIDGRVLSATSVSHALNKMNDTVLNTQTLIKDSGLQNRLSSAASAVVSVRSECNEKKGGLYNNRDDGEKASPKQDGKIEAKRDPSKKIDNQSSNNPSEGTKSDAAAENKSSTAEKITKVNPNNVNTFFSSTEPALKSTETQNNSKIDSFSTTVNSNSTNHISNNHVTTIGLGNARAIEREVQNNMNRLLGSMDSSLGDTPVSKMSANDRIREARTVIAADVKPIRITVREKPSDVEVQSGNVGPHLSISNGVGERPGLPPASHQQTPPNEPAKEEPPLNACTRFLKSCTKVLTCNKCQSCKRTPKVEEVQEEVEKTGCFNCLSKKIEKKNKREEVTINIEDENGQVKKSIWEKLKCCKRNKVGDTQSCFPIGKRKESWVERRAESFLESEVQQKTKCCSKLGCKNFFRKIFCCCCKKKEILPPVTRKESMISNKKKSLTPTTLPPPEDTRPKIDASLVEHTSHMKGAIPVLPVWLAWFCCVMNCIGPGTGTVLSGLFCLCIGKPRFSQKDGPKPRIGSFVINLIIGFSQFFTVLFCLVGWGWSIWWGVIMVKIAKKHKRFKHLEYLEEVAARPQPLAGQPKRDAARGRT